MSAYARRRHQLAAKKIHSRERAGLIELPKLRLEPGARVRVLQGPLQDQIGLLAALRPHERVLVLLQLLGGQQRSLQGMRSRRFE